MLIYEVTATVDDGLAAKYEEYMTRQHIPDLLATGHFAAAFFARNGSQYKMGYHADSQDHLDTYLANDAERLRADAVEHFPSGVESSRQVWEVIALFPSPIDEMIRG